MYAYLARYTKRATKFKLYLGCLIITLVGTSCSMVKVSYQPSFQTIDEQRGNIVTRGQLSDKTLSTLRSNGISETACLANMDICLDQLKNSIFNGQKQSLLALSSELHIAKAISLGKEEACGFLVRPPIDPYYANAPLSDDSQTKKNQQTKQCHVDYRVHLLEAIKHSYAYLFYEDLSTNNTPINTNNTLNIPNTDKTNYLPTDTDIQTQDIYEFASDALVRLLYNQYSKRYDTTTPEHLAVDDASITIRTLSNNSASNNKKTSDQINILEYKINNEAASGDLSINSSITIDLSIPYEPEYRQLIGLENQAISELYASDNLTFNGLNTISQRDGVGVSYVTLLKGRDKTSLRDLLKSGADKLNAQSPADRIHRTGNLLLSSIVKPSGATLDETLSSQHFDINLYNPHRVETVDILGKPYALTANFSASYGMWLTENSLDNVGYFSMLARQQALTLPQLYQLTPYDPNKRVIIMMHGLASSPATWLSLTNDIFNDKTLRENYQVWQIFYPTNVPMLENRYQIQKLIETAYRQNDPEQHHAASQHSVLVGHSMGAVIGRMMLSDENLASKLSGIENIAKDRQLNNQIRSELNKQNIEDRLYLKPLAPVDRAVFMSAPFRGTDYADRWFTVALRRIIQLPLGFVQTIKGNLKSIATEGELTDNPLGALYLKNGASQLSNKSSFMQLTGDLKIADKVIYHSIIGSDDPDITQGIAMLSNSTNAQLDLSESSVPESSDNNNVLSELPAKASNFEDGAPLVASVNVAGNVSDALSKDLTDGIVPYESSHLEGAASETIIYSGHGVQETPQAIITLRKILHEQLAAHPINDK